MPHRKVALVSIVFALSFLANGGAIAAALRTFVSGSGIDTNPCTLALPCRSFATAITQTASDGEIIVLDSAGYGPVTFTQPVSIVAPRGVYAGVSVLTGTGIVVAQGAGTVVLSGLNIIGHGGVTGIDFQSGDALRIEGTTVSGFSGVGLKAFLTAPAVLMIHNSTFVANPLGIHLRTSASVLTVEIDGSRFDRNGSGAQFEDNVRGVVSNSSFNGNLVGGAFVQAATSGTTANLSFRNCVFSGNSYGIMVGVITESNVAQITDSEVSDNGNGVVAQPFGTVTLSNTTVTRNGVGVSTPGVPAGEVRSFQDNRLYGNATDGVFTSTITKK
jgi:hypothetical protein